MPLTTYCGSCAAKNEYTVTKPRFCGACGKPFDAAFAAPKAPSLKPTRASDTDDEDYANEDDDSSDANLIHESAQALAARIDPSTFTCHAEGVSVKVSDVATNKYARQHAGIRATQIQAPRRP